MKTRIAYAQALRIMDEADEGQHVIFVSALTLAEGRPNNAHDRK
jgi:hypothetical protein